MKKTPCYLTALIFLSILLCLLLKAQNTYAVDSIFTVQSGSFKSTADARKQYDSIVRKLNKDNLAFLRIERIGRFYTVRIGKFNDISKAEQFLISNQPALSGAIVMNAYMKDERIEKIYEEIMHEEKPPAADDPESSPVPEPEQTNAHEKSVVPRTLDEQIEIISGLVKSNNYDRALEETESAMAARPEEPQLIGWHGAVLIKKNLPEKALKYFRKASELSPSVPDYHSGLGYCLFFLDRLDEAIDEFNKTLVLDPGHLDALAGLGAAYKKTGDREKAMDIYNRLKGINSDVADRILQVIEGDQL
ncbi:MAG: tetratricopeptide repeat protein [Nitrospirota bacterium]